MKKTREGRRKGRSVLIIRFRDLETGLEIARGRRERDTDP